MQMSIATVQTEDVQTRRGVILVEAKSYPGEISGLGCKASSVKSLSMIEEALRRTRDWLGVPEEKKEVWIGSLYQTANRLAHLYFFNQVVRRPVWFLNVCFLDDSTATHSTSRDEWDGPLTEAEEELGIADRTVPNTVYVFLKAREHQELCSR